MQTKKLKLAALGFMASLLISTSAFGEGAVKTDSKVIAYPAPLSEGVRAGFSVYANGKKVDLYRALSPNFEGTITKFRENKTAEKLYDCSIKNLTVSGKKGKFTGALYFKGLDAAHDVKDISLENITYFGNKIGADHNYFIDTKGNTSNISIK